MVNLAKLDFFLQDTCHLKRATVDDITSKADERALWAEIENNVILQCFCVAMFTEWCGAQGLETGKCSTGRKLQHKGIISLTVGRFCFRTEFLEVAFLGRDPHVTVTRLWSVLCVWYDSSPASPDCRLRSVQPLPQRPAAADLLRQPPVRLSWDREREALPRPRGIANTQNTIMTHSPRAQLYWSADWINSWYWYWLPHSWHLYFQI